MTEGQREFAGEDEARRRRGRRRRGRRGAGRRGEAPTAAAAARGGDARRSSPSSPRAQTLTLATPARRASPSRSSRSRRRATTRARSCASSRSAASAGPSTYAEIISKVQARDYVEKLAAAASSPRCSASSWSTASCDRKLDFMDPAFTSQMEEELDEVGAGHARSASQLLKRFYKRFREQLDKSKKLASWKPAPEKTDIVCDDAWRMRLHSIPLSPRRMRALVLAIL